MDLDHRTYLKRRFPYLDRAIDEKFLQNAEFRSLSADYIDAVNALRRLEDAAEPSLSKRIVEYRTLVQNLEAEILVELYRVAGAK
jgi:hypothetical protein